MKEIKEAYLLYEFKIIREKGAQFPRCVLACKSNDSLIVLMYYKDFLKRNKLICLFGTENIKILI